MVRPVVLRWIGLGLTGSVLAGLAACGTFNRGAEREAWRGQVEAACLRSGVVRETAGIRLVRAIEGPGPCGIDHPFKVSALESLVAPRPALAALRDPAAASAAGLPMQLPGAEGTDPLLPPGAMPAPAPAPAGFIALPDLPAQPAPVQMQSDGPFAVSLDRSVVMSCSMVPTMERWLTESVQPAALAAFGSPVVEVTSFGTYSCRRMDNRRVGRMSEHAFANAIDVKGFRLANGRETRILGGWRGSADEQTFWRDVAFGACDLFSTVLGPGASDGLHENHLHLDMARHSVRANLHVCRPRVPAGWIPLALRVSQPGQMPVQAEPAFTGSIEEPLKGEEDD